ncbi:MAG: helix-turn-helix domain-containing protein [bacterium]|nr:helix-turn-helix domain-containing protein [bacterium]
MTKEIKEQLAELGFKPNESRVYVALTTLGEATASIIARKLDLPRTTVISIVEKLSGDGFVSSHRYKGVTSYWIESPKTLVSRLETKVKVASALSDVLKTLYRAEPNFPEAHIFDTRAGIRHFIEKWLADLPKGAVIQTIDNPEARNYAAIFSDQIESVMIGLKNAKGIQTKTLVPCGTRPAITEKKLKGQAIEIRELPQGVTFPASLWIAGNQIVLFSGRPPFAVAIKHPAIVESCKSFFSHFWGT